MATESKPTEPTTTTHKLLNCSGEGHKVPHPPWPMHPRSRDHRSHKSASWCSRTCCPWRISAPAGPARLGEGWPARDGGSGRRAPACPRRTVALGVQDVGVPGIIHLLRRHWLQAGAHQGQVFAVLLWKLCCLRGRVAVPLHQDGHHGGHIQRFDLLGRGVEPAHLLERRLAPRLLALCVLSRACSSSASGSTKLTPYDLAAVYKN